MRERSARAFGDILALAMILSDDEPATRTTPEELAADGLVKPEAKDRAARAAVDGMVLPKGKGKGDA